MDRRTFFQHLPLHTYSPDDLRRIRQAYWLAKEAHRTQSRDGGERYFEHPRAVTLLLIEFGYTNADTICTGLLHDAVEDTFTPPDLYVQLFGATVWLFIQTLSKVLPAWDPVTGEIYGWVKKNLEDYFAQIAKLPPGGQIVKVCDRLHNLRTCAGWTPERKQRYTQETRQWILPIAQRLDHRLAEAIEAELTRIDREVAQATPTT